MNMQCLYTGETTALIRMRFLMQGPKELLYSEVIN